MAGNSLKPHGLFKPDRFMGLLFESPNGLRVPEGLGIYSEKELSQLFDRIVEALRNSDDWQKRMAGLELLQKCVIGDGIECEGLIPLLRTHQELIGSQILDMRSIVSKEACRTIALVARRLSSQFSVIVETIFPKLLKQTLQKVQGISADKAARLIIISTPNGYPRLLERCFTESFSSKAPVLRKSILDCCCLAGATWKLETLERSIGPLCVLIRGGISDADVAARRAGRQLYWVLNERATLALQQGEDVRTATDLKTGLEKCMDGLEKSLQKQVLAEMDNPSNQDLIDLLELAAMKELPPYGQIPDLPIVEEVLSEPLRDVPSPSPKNVPPVESNEAPEVRKKDHSRSSKATIPVAMSSVSGRLASGVATSEGLKSRAVRLLAVESASALESSGKALPVSSVFRPGKSSRRASLAPAVRIIQDPVIHHAPAELSSKEPVGTTVHNFREESPIANLLQKSHSASLHKNRIPPAEQGRVETGSMSKNPPSANTLGEPGRIVLEPKLSIQSKEKPLVQETGSCEEDELACRSQSDIDDAVEATRSCPAVNQREDPSSQLRLESTIWSFDNAKIKVEDSHWNERLAGFESLSSHLNYFAPIQFEQAAELAMVHFGDPHQKVAFEALNMLSGMIQSHSTSVQSKLGQVLVALFHRLADRRTTIRDASNELLNLIRAKYDPVIILTTLSPRILDMPDRIKAAFMQYLAAIVPYCGTYFASATNSLAFLGRMANIFGNASSKPSSTLLVSGKRLLELVYKTSPQMICSQIGGLPLQQQTTLKKILQDRVPDIDAQVSVASKLEWNNRSKSKPGHQHPQEQHQHGHHQQQQQEEKKNESPTLKVPPVSNGISRSPQSPPGETVPLLARGRQTKPMDIRTLLESLRPGQETERKIEAIQEIKRLARNTENLLFWKNNCAQIIMVLMENFQLPPSVAAVLSPVNPLSPTYDRKMALTGFTPPGKVPAISLVRSNSASPSVSSLSAALESEGCNPDVLRWVHSIHLSCKALLVMVRNVAPQMKNLMVIITSRLCDVSYQVPLAIALHCEQLLSELGKQDPFKMMTLMEKYVALEEVEKRLAGTPQKDCRLSSGCKAQVTLLALHVMTDMIPHVTSDELLGELPELIQIAIPCLGHGLVDIRQAVIAMLVEAYVVLGDALQPFALQLSPAQQKLLTIYIEKKMNPSKS